ncbi:aldo/keto reductase [Fulvivirga sediminis]|uniref:Aldo/keto reductase n=1 Tax=Fulvivirga sediminis TaxID=2803949 RepID=A0A937JZ16_9BACT|nr:aldo/keto reductase [Fulvivirga sediminis]MBL3656229.1 aldo/keto reductase [Fulvivirga sediminis]
MNISNLNGTLSLKNGVEMPYLGLGVYKAKGDEVIQAVKHALFTGYRAIDTAAMYKNEKGVGKAIASSPLKREEIFITSKVWNSDQGYDSTIKAFHHSLNELDFKYLDLFLIHWPVKEKYQDTWRALETLYEEGKIKAIGVSNFLTDHLEDLFQTCKIKPMVNQFEFHPKLIQQDLIDFCHRNEIKTQAWSPLMQGDLNNEALAAIGNKYNKTVAQVILRWDLQKGIATIPKSSNPDRIEENANIFDFQLSEKDMQEIDNLNQDRRLGPNPANFNF